MPSLKTLRRRLSRHSTATVSKDMRDANSWMPQEDDASSFLTAKTSLEMDKSMTTTRISEIGFATNEDKTREILLNNESASFIGKMDELSSIQDASFKTSASSWFNVRNSLGNESFIPTFKDDESFRTARETQHDTTFRTDSSLLVHKTGEDETLFESREFHTAIFMPSELVACEAELLSVAEDQPSIELHTSQILSQSGETLSGTGAVDFNVQRMEIEESIDAGQFRNNTNHSSEDDCLIHKPGEEVISKLETDRAQLQEIILNEEETDAAKIDEIPMPSSASLKSVFEAAWVSDQTKMDEEIAPSEECFEKHKGACDLPSERKEYKVFQAETDGPIVLVESKDDTFTVARTSSSSETMSSELQDGSLASSSSSLNASLLEMIFGNVRISQNSKKQKSPSHENCSESTSPCSEFICCM